MQAGDGITLPGAVSGRARNRRDTRGTPRRSLSSRRLSRPGSSSLSPSGPVAGNHPDRSRFLPTRPRGPGTHGRPARQSLERIIQLLFVGSCRCPEAAGYRPLAARNLRGPPPRHDESSSLAAEVRDALVRNARARRAFRRQRAPRSPRIVAPCPTSRPERVQAPRALARRLPAPCTTRAARDASLSRAGSRPRPVLDGRCLGEDDGASGEDASP